MFHPRHLSTALKVLALALVTLVCASSASASGCLAQGQTLFQNCIESMASDGTVTSWEDAVCSSLTADVVTECGRQAKPGLLPYDACAQTWTIWFTYDANGGIDSIFIVFHGSLTCT